MTVRGTERGLYKHSPYHKLVNHYNSGAATGKETLVFLKSEQFPPIKPEYAHAPSSMTSFVTPVYKVKPPPKRKVLQQEKRKFLESGWNSSFGSVLTETAWCLMPRIRDKVVPRVYRKGKLVTKRRTKQGFRETTPQEQHAMTHRVFGGNSDERAIRPFRAIGERGGFNGVMKLGDFAMRPITRGDLATRGGARPTTRGGDGRPTSRGGGRPTTRGEALQKSSLFDGFGDTPISSNGSTPVPTTLASRNKDGDEDYGDDFDESPLKEANSSKESKEFEGGEDYDVDEE
eukprot:CAMPEP_0175141038 /NCGR_PEP_ID=MMETSP0087-20121206/11857_1 /TAXON_ID=136419 /ORGANISM="Unknown Unknown, Strain D1" /LENGTH=287 /DNA_ID=CAMNT_0016424357 /DNA_START=94 /DNA_END=957 /DNA_ORIENTATION=+